MSSTPKKFKLRIRWSEKDNNFKVFYPRKSDGAWILDRIIGHRTKTGLRSTILKSNHPEWTCRCGVDWNENIGVFDIDFIQELINRGFDKKTLKFEISINLKELGNKFAHLLLDLTDAEKQYLLTLGIDPHKKS